MTSLSGRMTTIIVKIILQKYQFQPQQNFPLALGMLYHTINNNVSIPFIENHGKNKETYRLQVEC